MLLTEHHSSWNEFLTDEILELLNSIEKQIGNDYTPKKENVLRFMKQDLAKIKCVWLGQDPYFSMYGDNHFVANGKSFQPDDLKDWNQKFSQVSLKNIVRLIYKSENNITFYNDIKKFNDIKKEINSGVFKILPPKEWFNSLEKQGVLFLNTSLTTKQGTANAHKNIWAEFSQKLLNYISEKNPNIHWFLWGNEACQKAQFIKHGILHQSNHPMMCSESKENDFLKSDCFSSTKDIINWLG